MLFKESFLIVLLAIHIVEPSPVDSEAKHNVAGSGSRRIFQDPVPNFFTEFTT
jgi:hypothetical protein